MIDGSKIRHFFVPSEAFLLISGQKTDEYRIKIGKYPTFNYAQTASNNKKYNVKNKYCTPGYFLRYTFAP